MSMTEWGQKGKEKRKQKEAGEIVHPFSTVLAVQAKLPEFGPQDPCEEAGRSGTHLLDPCGPC